MTAGRHREMGRTLFALTHLLTVTLLCSGVLLIVALLVTAAWAAFWGFVFYGGAAAPAANDFIVSDFGDYGWQQTQMAHDYSRRVVFAPEAGTGGLIRLYGNLTQQILVEENTKLLDSDTATATAALTKVEEEESDSGEHLPTTTRNGLFMRYGYGNVEVPVTHERSLQTSTHEDDKKALKQTNNGGWELQWLLGPRHPTRSIRSVSLSANGEFLAVRESHTDRPSWDSVKIYDAALPTAKYLFDGQSVCAGKTVRLATSVTDPFYFGTDGELNWLLVDCFGGGLVEIWQWEIYAWKFVNIANATHGSLSDEKCDQVTLQFLLEKEELQSEKKAFLHYDCLAQTVQVEMQKPLSLRKGNANPTKEGTKITDWELAGYFLTGAALMFVLELVIVWCFGLGGR